MTRPARVLRAVSALLLAAQVAAPELSLADEARARKIVMGVCFLCHGAEGESSSEEFPRLAGQNAEYVAKQLENFKSGKRKSTTMAPMVVNLSADDMMALGRYFERQKHTSEPAKDAALAAKGSALYHNGNAATGVSACASCHGPQAQGTATLPRLAGQFAAYTENQLKLFHKRERTNDNAVMHAVVEKMTPQEMAAVAEYLSAK